MSPTLSISVYKVNLSCLRQRYPNIKSVVSDNHFVHKITMISEEEAKKRESAAYAEGKKAGWWMSKGAQAAGDERSQRLGVVGDTLLLYLIWIHARKDQASGPRMSFLMHNKAIDFALKCLALQVGAKHPIPMHIFWTVLTQRQFKMEVVEHYLRLVKSHPLHSDLEEVRKKWSKFCSVRFERWRSAFKTEQLPNMPYFPWWERCGIQVGKRLSLTVRKNGLFLDKGNRL